MMSTNISDYIVTPAIIKLVIKKYGLYTPLPSPKKSW